MSDLAEEVADIVGGIGPASALTVKHFLTDEGESDRNAERAIQRALNLGLVVLGPELKLCLPAARPEGPRP